LREIELDFCRKRGKPGSLFRSISDKPAGRRKTPGEKNSSGVE
jgi:hypothetical protein